MGRAALFAGATAATRRDPWFVRTTEYPGVGSSLAHTERLPIPPGETVVRRVVTVVADGALGSRGRGAGSSGEPHGAALSRPRRRHVPQPRPCADWLDLDLLCVGDDFYLTASSFGRVPGLPLLHSRDLVNWTLVGHALQLLEPAGDFREPRHDCGVWAPSLRTHEDRFWIFWATPTTASSRPTPSIPRSLDPAAPRQGGQGTHRRLPAADEETGEAYLVHAWAKSRSGVKNRLTGHRMRPDGTGLLDEGEVIIDAVTGSRAG